MKKDALQRRVKAAKDVWGRVEKINAALQKLPDSKEKKALQAKIDHALSGAEFLHGELALDVKLWGQQF